MRNSQSGPVVGAGFPEFTTVREPIEEHIPAERVAPPMAAPGQYVQVPGPVEYKRQYTLWILILLVLVCWPVAIIYYFTREKVPVQQLTTYTAPVAQSPGWAGAPPAGAAGTRFCPSCGAAGQRSGSFCASCGKPVPP
jgi:hypothetical protein